MLLIYCIEDPTLGTFKFYSDILVVKQLRFTACKDSYRGNSSSKASQYKNKEVSLTIHWASLNNERIH